MVKHPRRLNFHHLFYFWAVVREGGIRRASQWLGVAQPTISEQLAALERDLGETLFDRAGKKMVLSESGQVAFRYASEIFTLGDELVTAMTSGTTVRKSRLMVGVTEGIPKMLVYKLLAPVIEIPDPALIVCYEDPIAKLVQDLASHELDVVLSDSTAPSDTTTTIYHHLLGVSGTTFFARRDLAVRVRPWFPKSLGTTALLLPTHATFRTALESWFHHNGIRPHLAGEFQDAGLLARFGEQGMGVFPACTAVEQHIRSHYRAEIVGRVPEIRQRFYALTVDRKLVHPAVLALTRTARTELFRRDVTDR